MGFYIGLLFRTFAILAKPVQHHCVFAEFVTVAERNDGLCPFNIRINKFHNFSALQPELLRNVPLTPYEAFKKVMSSS